MRVDLPTFGRPTIATNPLLKSEGIVTPLKLKIDQSDCLDLGFRLNLD